MKVYISGKISGLSKSEYESNFNEAKKIIDSSGHTAISPVDLPHNHGKSWAEYMIEGLEALRHCDAIFMLDDWGQSPGAKIELQFARRIGLHVFGCGFGVIEQIQKP